MTEAALIQVENTPYSPNLLLVDGGQALGSRGGESLATGYPASDLLLQLRCMLII